MIPLRLTDCISHVSTKACFFFLIFLNLTFRWVETRFSLRSQFYNQKIDKLINVFILGVKYYLIVCNRCTFTDHIRELKNDTGDDTMISDKFLVICESLGLKMLSNANLFLVSVDMPVSTNLDDASGLCLRFSCEILSNSMPCLITVTLEGNCSEPLNATVKVNCEETVFGLNLLNRIVNFLAEPPLTW